MFCEQDLRINLKGKKQRTKLHSMKRTGFVPDNVLHAEL